MHQPPLNLTSLVAIVMLSQEKRPFPFTLKKIEHIKPKSSTNATVNKKKINKHLFPKILKKKRNKRFSKFERYYFNRAHSERASTRRHGAHYVNVSAIGTCAGRGKAVCRSVTIFRATDELLIGYNLATESNGFFTST